MGTLNIKGLGSGIIPNYIKKVFIDNVHGRGALKKGYPGVWY